MPCRVCGTEPIPGKRFCHFCGAPLASVCPSCSAPVEPEFRFCPDCGHQLAPGERPGAAPPEQPSPRPLRAPRIVPGERKLVTVLFCDLVGSTPLAERLDPEEFRDLLDQYFEIALAQINRLDGFTTQLAGDGIMALFGAPIAHEDAPQRAVHAALAIREALSSLSRRLHSERGVELQVRMGIHTGPVVVGTMGDDRTMSYTAVGDTTNLASRLETLARPGAILISEATQRLVRGFFRLRSAGSLELRGKAEPVIAFEVTGLQDTATPMAVARERGLTPFVGRDDEIGQLRACSERMQGAIAQVVAIIGGAGSGKSRLVYEFRQSAGDDLTFLEARCSALTQGVPYAPFTTMLRQFFGLTSAERGDEACEKIARAMQCCDARLEPHAPYLCRLLALPVRDLPELPAEELRRETFEAVAQLVIALSEQKPVVMIVEDLQWIDESSREMLELGLARMRSARVMMIITQRPDHQRSWSTRAAFHQLNLLPLSEEETLRIIRSVAGGQLPSSLETRILVKAEGNPFFAEEITRALLEEGLVVQQNGRVQLTRPLDQVRIPDTIHEVLAARLDRLAAPAKRVVQVAAVLGRQFSRHHVAALLEPEGIDVEAACAELDQRGVIHRKSLLSGDEFRFGESLTQEVAYESLLLKERRQLHERIGQLLEEDSEEMTADRSGLIAHHFARSENRERAATWMLRAAEDAERLPSYLSATAFFREAWQAAELGLAEDSGPPEKMMRLALEGVGGFCRMVVLYGSSNTAGSEEAARRGQELAERLGDEENLAGFYAYQGLILMALERERFAEGLTLLERGFSKAQQAGGPSLTALNIARGLAFGYFHDGRFELGLRMFDWVIGELQRAEAHRERPSDFHLGALFNRDYLLFACGDLAQSARSACSTYELAVASGNRTMQAASAGLLALATLVHGEAAEAKRWADEGLEIAQAIGTVVMIRTSALAALGSRCELGEVPAGQVDRYLELIEQGFVARGDMAWKSVFVADVMLAAGRADRARQFVELARPHAGGKYREVTCAAAMGDVLRQQGELEEAERWYREAVDLAQAIGARQVLAQAKLGLGALLFLRGESRAAREILCRSIEISRRFGYGRYEKRAQALLTSLADAPAVTDASRSPLA